MTSKMVRAALRVGGMMSLALLGAQGAQAQQIVSAIESEWDNGDQPAKDYRASSTTAGELVSTTHGGSDVRALTDYGVNKVFAEGGADYKTYATSAWLDSYTIDGASRMVDVSFTVTVDGMAMLDGNYEDEPNYNFKLYALRGTAWSLDGEGDGYDRLNLTFARPNGTKSVIDARDFDGINNFDTTGTLVSQTFYDAATDTYTILNSNGNSTVLTPTYLQVYNAAGMPVGRAQYYDSTPAAAQARESVVSNYLLLGMDQFCDAAENECGTLSSSGTDVTVSFSMPVGSTFSLAGYLFADDIFDGTVDFYNTAKITDIRVSGGTLSAASGSLVDLGNGRYGYEAALAGAVPEPSAWALLILGFGLTGATMRRRALGRLAAA